MANSSCQEEIFYGLVVLSCFCALSKYALARPTLPSSARMLRAMPSMDVLRSAWLDASW